MGGLAALTPCAAKILKSMGGTAKDLNDPALAAHLLERVLAAQEAELGEGREVALTLFHLGNKYFVLDDSDQAPFGAGALPRRA